MKLNVLFAYLFLILNFPCFGTEVVERGLNFDEMRGYHCNALHSPLSREPAEESLNLVIDNLKYNEILQADLLKHLNVETWKNTFEMLQYSFSGLNVLNVLDRLAQKMEQGEQEDYKLRRRLIKAGVRLTQGAWGLYEGTAEEQRRAISSLKSLGKSARSFVDGVIQSEGSSGQNIIDTYYKGGKKFLNYKQGGDYLDPHGIAVYDYFLEGYVDGNLRLFWEMITYVNIDSSAHIRTQWPIDLMNNIFMPLINAASFGQESWFEKLPNYEYGKADNLREVANKMANFLENYEELREGNGGITDMEGNQEAVYLVFNIDAFGDPKRSLFEQKIEGFKDFKDFKDNDIWNICLDEEEKREILEFIQEDFDRDYDLLMQPRNRSFVGFKGISALLMRMSNNLKQSNGVIREDIKRNKVRTARALMKTLIDNNLAYAEEESMLIYLMFKNSCMMS